MGSTRVSGLFRTSYAASFEAWQLLQGGTEHVLNLFEPAMQNPRTGPHSYSKENSQYETVARDRREQKQSPEAPKGGVQVAAAIDEENREAVGSRP